MASTKHTAGDVIAAIEGSGGVKATIAARLNVHRHTIDNYISRWSSVAEAYDDEVEKIGDKAESVIIKGLYSEDLALAIQTAKWYAANKLADRGYTTRIDNRHSTPPGESLNINITSDLMAQAQAAAQQHAQGLTGDDSND